MKVKELTRMLHGLEGFDLKDCGITTEILDALDAQPVVHGEWIDYKDLPTYDDYYQYSICGVLSKGKFYFCSNCGAKMDGERD